MNTVYSILSRIFHWFYCLSPAAILCLLLAAGLVFSRLHRRLRRRLWWRVGLVTAMVLWTGVILYATVLNRTAEGSGGGWLPLLHSYREVLAGGNPELLRSNFMNAVLFFPGGLLLGALLPARWPRWGRAAMALVCLGGISLAVEFAQYRCALGMAEADDILHNTLGAVLGAWILPPEKPTRSDLT